MDVHRAAGRGRRRDARRHGRSSRSRAGRRRRAAPLGRVTEVLGDIDEPGVDTEIIIRKYGIPDAHSRRGDRRSACGSAARSREKDIRGRTDFRDRRRPSPSTASTRATSTTRSRSSSCRTATTGSACTSPTSSHYVQEGSALDEEAYERGTSVYFPERAVHMFPSELATGLCSLNPHVDRLVQSCLMEVDRRGQRRPLRVPRRRHQQRRADDLHAVNAILTDRDPGADRRSTRRSCRCSS